MEVMTAPFPGDWFNVDPGGREDPLPRPLAIGPRVLGSERAWQRDEASTGGEVAPMLLANTVNLRGQGFGEYVRQGDFAVFLSLAVAYGDFAALEVNVFDSEGGTFPKAKPSLSEDMRIQKQDCGEGLVLRRSTDFELFCQVAQEARDVGALQNERVTLPVKGDKAAHPDAIHLSVRWL